MKYISFYSLLLAIVFTLDEADSNHRWLLYLVADPVMWIEIFIIHSLEIIIEQKKISFYSIKVLTKSSKDDII